MASKDAAPFDPEKILDTLGDQRTVLEVNAKRLVYTQGKSANAVFYVKTGKVKLSVTSPEGKESIVAVFGPRDFFGEECLAGRQLRLGTAAAMTDCTLYRIEKEAMARLLHERHAAAEAFVAHLLCRNLRYEEDLVDQLFNSSEKRLARVLLLLANFGKHSSAEQVLPAVNHETLAQMVGTTRPRISEFMNKFRKLGFISYNDREGRDLMVNNGLLTIVLHD